MLVPFNVLVFVVSVSFARSDNVTCETYRDNLALAVSNFTDCSIKHSRPITLCQSCVEQYLTVLQSYHNLTTVRYKSERCIDKFINLDRLGVVESIYRSSYDLWNRAKCYECFEIVNGTLTSNTSQETEDFMELLNDALTCINISGSNTTKFCTACVDEYLQLNSYYISITNINEKIGMCMDIVDLMNDTRILWSKKCCNYRDKKDYIFLLSTGGVTFITLVFYILAKYCTDMKTTEILHQSRYAES